MYYDPGERYLVPHVIQSFLSGLADNERLFNSRLLTVASNVHGCETSGDHGNAATFRANPTPRNLIDVDIAPSYEPYETVFLRRGNPFELD